MNRPIRTVSLFCLLLFVALLANATYLQFWRAGALDDDPRNQRVQQASYSSERGAILVGRTPVAQSTPSDDRFEFQREYPQPLMYAPLTGYFTFGDSTGIESALDDVLSGEDARFFVRNLVDLVSNEQQNGANVELTINARAQRAAYEGLSALGPDVEGSVVAIEPDTGRVLAMVSLPTFDPNELASHDFDAVGRAYDRLEAAEGDPLLNRAVQTRLFPGSTFKVVTAAAALESGKYDDADSLVPGGATFQLPQTSGDSGLVDNGGRSCGTGPWSSRATPPSPSSPSRWAPRRCWSRPRSSASTPTTSRTSRARPARSSPRSSTPPSSARPGSDSSTCRRRRCRWPWSPPGSPTAGS